MWPHVNYCFTNTTTTPASILSPTFSVSSHQSFRTLESQFLSPLFKYYLFSIIEIIFILKGLELEVSGSVNWQFNHIPIQFIALSLNQATTGHLFIHLATPQPKTLPGVAALAGDLYKTKSFSFILLLVIFLLSCLLKMFSSFSNIFHLIYFYFVIFVSSSLSL